MSKYEVAFCGREEIGEVMAFFGAQWDENHLIARDRGFMDYFFYNRQKNRYNIIYGRDVATGAVAGFIAYLPMSAYDADIAPAEDFIWISNWLVSNQAKGNLGLQLYLKMQQEEACKNYGTLAQNQTAESIYRRFGYQIGALTQWFMADDDREDYRILSGYQGTAISADKPVEKPSGEPETIRLIPLAEEALERLTQKHHGRQRPEKTAAYLIEKYLHSPYYSYYIYGIERGDEAPEGAVVFRTGEYNGAVYLRIVEYIGAFEALQEAAPAFRHLLAVFSAEYMDFYCYGIADALLRSAGFEKNEGQGGLIVPNYFEPFLNENVTIPFAYHFAEDGGELTVYRGDCDREQPRRL